MDVCTTRFLAGLHPPHPRKARNSLIFSTLRNLLRSLLITKVNKKPIIFAP